MDYKQKYLKYKQKYLDLQEQLGGKNKSCKEIDYIVVEHCCTGENTQHMKNMCAESKKHLIASKVYQKNHSFDGIIGIYNKEIKDYYKTEVKILDGIGISDHDGILMIIDNKYPVLSYNLEGFCSGRKVEEQRKSKFKTQIENLFINKSEIYKNMIIICQEIILKDNKQINSNLDFITEIFNEITKTEDFKLNFNGTSCVIYNSKIWEIKPKEIPRPIEVEKKKENKPQKSSNAYKFTNKNNKMSFILVNIHLIAQKISRLIKGTFQELQDKELKNILNETIDFNSEKIPIYLCGDFNNHTPNNTYITKKKWIETLLCDSTLNKN